MSFISEPKQPYTRALKSNHEAVKARKWFGTRLDDNGALEIYRTYTSGLNALNNKGLVIRQDDIVNNPHALEIVNKGTGSAINIVNAGGGPTITVDTDGDNPSLDIDSESSSQTVVSIDASLLTTGRALEVVNLNALTTGLGVVISGSTTALTGTGRFLYVNQTGASTVSGTIVEINSDATDTDTTIFKVQAQAQTNAVIVQGNTGNIGFGVADPDSQLEINTTNATTQGLKIKGFASQSGSLLLLTDNSDNPFLDSGDGLAASTFVINEQGVDIDFRIEGTGNANLLYVDAGNDRVGIGTATPAGTVHIDQPGATGAIPVITLDQGDFSEEFVRLIGQSTTDASQSLVDAADLTTPGSVVGWFKIYVQDDQSSGPITDGVYYVPFYSAPTS